MLTVLDYTADCAVCLALKQYKFNVAYIYIYRASLFILYAYIFMYFSYMHTVCMVL